MDAIILWNIGDWFANAGNGIMTPLYWAMSGLLVGAHTLISPIFGQDSGVTWVLTILALTVVVRLLMTPLYAKQLNASRALQALQPQMKALQEKYGSDRERLGQETLKLQREEGVNPASSCLPLLIQLPIFWALYRVLISASRGTPRGYFFEKNPHLVESLSQATIFKADLSGTFLPLSQGFGATQILALVLIVAMTSIMFFQQLHMMRRNMPPSAMEGPFAQQQKMMLVMMPLMFVFAGLAIPIGVLIYWLTTNIWTLVQQWIIIRTYPTPNTPAHVEWEERMIAKGKDPVEIERRRADKGRRRPANRAKVTTDENGKPTVSRQRGVTRNTNREPERQVVRRQVKKQSRAQRKK